MPTLVSHKCDDLRKAGIGSRNFTVSVKSLYKMLSTKLKFSLSIIKCYEKKLVIRVLIWVVTILKSTATMN